MVTKQVGHKGTNLHQLRYRRDNLSSCNLTRISSQDFAAQEALKRKNLTDAVKIIPELCPTLVDVINKVSQRLLSKNKVEAYVFSSSDIQAYSFAGTDDQTIMIVLTSGLIRLVSHPELMFVIGHELGHFLMGHHRYPRYERVQSHTSRLNLLALQRAAEISADRLGFVACDSQKNAFQATMKLASGLPDELLRFDVAAYLDQGRELNELGGSEYELMSTHPTFTARIRALLWFEMSQPYYDWMKRRERAPLDASKLDDRIEKDLAAANGFRLMRANERTLHSALLWGVLAFFVADNRLTKDEQALVRSTFGEKEAGKAIGFVKQFGPEKVMAKFKESIRNVRHLSQEGRIALYGDLERFATVASGNEDIRGKLLRMVRDYLSLNT